MDYKYRSNTGQLGALYLLAILLAICVLGSIAMDINHAIEVKAELQNATDAAALAGAAHLWFDKQNAEPDAYKFAANNFADGRSVANTSKGTTVTVQVANPTATEHGSVTVAASMRISHFFARLFNHFDDEISVQSVAGTNGLMWRLFANQAFPLAVSLDAVPSTKNFTGTALNSLKVGDDFTVFVGAQGAKNGAFTSFTKTPANASYIKEAIDQCLGISQPVEGFIPSVQVTDEIDLNNGILGQQILAKNPYLSAMRNGPVLILPIIEGGAPYNKSRPIVGFIGFKVKSVQLHQDSGLVEAITGTLVAAQPLGESGGPAATDGSWPTNPISRVALGPIQLIK